MAQASIEVQGKDLPPAGKWELDPAHTTVEFVARHMLSKVRGRFAEFTGSFEIGEKVEDTRVQAEIRAASIQSGQEQRDGHLKSPDFLDVETYPVITFNSTGFRRTGDATFELDGDLTIRDTTRPVTLAGEVLGWGPDMQGTPMLAASAKATIFREDWNVSWNMVVETGGFLVSKRIDIEIEVEARLQG